MESSSTYILIQNATVLSDGDSPVLPSHDILIRNDRIIAVGQNLTEPSDGGLTRIAAGGAIAMPGFVDGHHHMWQQLLRGIATDWTLFDYLVNIRNMYGGIFTPDDVYLATYSAALSLLNNGVTTVLEHCHIINSPAHADAAVRALKDAGIRGTFCYGFYENPFMPGLSSAETHLPDFTPDARNADAARVRKQYFGSNDPAQELLTFGTAPDEPEALPVEKTMEAIRKSRELGARLITMHVAMGPCDAAHRHIVQQLADADLLGPDLVFSHGASFTESELDAINASGAGIVGTPDTELQMGMGFPVVFRAKDAGCHACLGIDITSNQNNDFMAQMRLALQVQRALQNKQGGYPIKIARKTSEVLRMGTLGGAEVLQLDHIIGTLEVGKKADILLISRDDIDSLPTNDIVGSVVFHTSPSHIHTVIVDGKIKKTGGKLVEDVTEIRERVQKRGAEMMAQTCEHDLADSRQKWLQLLQGARLA
ncbi:unnamed protein product [Fusarium langsethiae]|nr:unnamed protein product [Fusarium langsethiae]